MAELMNFPVDLLMKILILLPAKTLLQFKRVCKSWYQLISSDHFASLHLDQTLTLTLAENPNAHFIFSAPHLSSADFDTFDQVTELDYPFREYGRIHVDVVGSCHGLLCLRYDETDIVLYNPTTRTHRTVPFSPVPSGFGDLYWFGFGYDHVSREYKFVSIQQSCLKLRGNSFSSHKVMVYSLRAGSWTEVGDFPHHFAPEHRGGVFVDGSLHWIDANFGVVWGQITIVCFNLGNNKFGEVPQPLYGEEFLFFSVGVLDGCLCLFADGYNSTNIWVMKEYGGGVSWTRLLKVKIPEKDPFLALPIALSMNRRELFLHLLSLKIVSLDLETMVVKDVKGVGFANLYGTHVVVENLTMLKHGCSEVSEIDNKHENKRQRRRDRKRRKISKPLQVQREGEPTNSAD